MDPQLLAGRRVERDERVAVAAAVDGAADDERVEVGLAGRIRPGDLELADVGLGDLGRGDEPRAVGAAGVVAPFARPLAGKSGAGCGGHRQRYIQSNDHEPDPPAR